MTMLTIGVPSYNDSVMLERTLRNLLTLTSNPEIEILVSDNHSPDNSADVLDKYVSMSNNRISSFVQTSNLGFRGNLRFLSENASGKYIWFIGIGEQIQTACLDGVLDALGSSAPTNAVVSGKFAEDLIEVSDELHFEESQVDPRTPLFSETISLNILRRDLAADSLGKASSSTGDYWPHIEAVLEARAREGLRANTIFSSAPIVSIAPNFDGWWFDRDESYELSLAQIRILFTAASGSGSHPWLTRRLRRMRTLGLGEIVLRARKNGRKFSWVEIQTMEVQGKLNFFQRRLLGIAQGTPLWLFRLLTPLARIF
jgi:glycosyltransferase involved in cell wall biosynthesis